MFFTMIRITCRDTLQLAKRCLYESLKDIVLQKSQLMLKKQGITTHMRFQVECHVKSNNSGGGFNNCVNIFPTVEDFQCTFTAIVKRVLYTIDKYTKEIESAVSNLSSIRCVNVYTHAERSAADSNNLKTSIEDEHVIFILNSELMRLLQNQLILLNAFLLIKTLY